MTLNDFRGLLLARLPYVRWRGDHSARASVAKKIRAARTWEAMARAAEDLDREDRAAFGASWSTAAVNRCAPWAV